MMTFPLAAAARPYITETYANGRSVLTYEPGSRYDPNTQYLIVEQDGFTAMTQLSEMGFRNIQDVFDVSNPYMWGLPVDWKFGNARIGKGSFYNSVEFNFSASVFFESVGRFCSINETAYFQHNHPMNMIGTGRFQQFMSQEKQMQYFQTAARDPHIRNPGEKLVIGNDVWIGANTFINTSLCHSIGDGAIIAAGAVVNCDVPPYAVFAGVPGKVVKYRYSEAEVEALLRVRWWDWSDEEMERNADLLMDPAAFFEAFR